MTEQQIEDLSIYIVEGIHSLSSSCAEDMCAEVESRLKTWLAKESIADIPTRVDWTKAPQDAAGARVIVNYYDSNNVPLQGVSQILISEERPTFISGVAEGQTWRYEGTGDLYLVVLVGEMKPDWIDSVTYRSADTGKGYTRALDDFLTKFTRIT
jgi:hypothetical protein